MCRTNSGIQWTLLKPSCVHVHGDLIVSLYASQAQEGTITLQGHPGTVELKHGSRVDPRQPAHVAQVGYYMCVDKTCQLVLNLLGELQPPPVYTDSILNEIWIIRCAKNVA